MFIYIVIFVVVASGRPPAVPALGGRGGSCCSREGSDRLILVGHPFLVHHTIIIIIVGIGIGGVRSGFAALSSTANAVKIAVAAAAFRCRFRRSSVNVIVVIGVAAAALPEAVAVAARGTNAADGSQGSVPSGGNGGGGRSLSQAGVAGATLLQQAARVGEVSGDYVNSSASFFLEGWWRVLGLRRGISPAACGWESHLNLVAALGGHLFKEFFLLLLLLARLCLDVSSRVGSLFFAWILGVLALKMLFYGGIWCLVCLK